MATLQITETLITGPLPEGGTGTTGRRLDFHWQGAGPIEIEAAALTKSEPQVWPSQGLPELGDTRIFGPFVCHVRDWDPGTKCYRFERWGTPPDDETLSMVLPPRPPPAPVDPEADNPARTS